MGRGDIRTKRGKIANGSFGKKRPAKQEKNIVAAETKEAKPKKKPAKKTAKKTTG